MVVSELIAFLAQCKPDARVVIDGYEGGLEDVVAASLVNIRVDANQDADYYGHHLIDEVSPDEHAVWIRDGMARGDKHTVQDMERFKKQGIW